MLSLLASCVMVVVDELSLKVKAKAVAGPNELPHHEDVRGSGALILRSLLRC